MCLAIPMEVVKIENYNAWVSVGDIQKEVRLELIDEMPQVGDYVLVHAGFALHRIDEKTAMETLKLFEELLSNEASE
ncbi:MAG: HypC/HybG/HupF family hydrogenase formation chaperone [bacterium]|jgi:hydrogenase expression/formation protein HypC